MKAINVVALLVVGATAQFYPPGWSKGLDIKPGTPFPCLLGTNKPFFKDRWNC